MRTPWISKTAPEVGGASFAGLRRDVVVSATPEEEVNRPPPSPLESQSSIDIQLVKEVRYRSEDRMTTITISPKFQIVIPKAIRDLLGLRPGQKVQAIAYEDRIELIPVRRMKEMRGFLRGIDTAVEREPDRA